MIRGEAVVQAKKPVSKLVTATLRALKDELARVRLIKFLNSGAPLSVKCREMVKELTRSGAVNSSELRTESQTIARTALFLFPESSFRQGQFVARMLRNCYRPASQAALSINDPETQTGLAQVLNSYTALRGVRTVAYFGALPEQYQTAMKETGQLLAGIISILATEQNKESLADTITAKTAYFPHAESSRLITTAAKQALKPITAGTNRTAQIPPVLPSTVAEGFHLAITVVERAGLSLSDQLGEVLDSSRQKATSGLKSGVARIREIVFGLQI